MPVSSLIAQARRGCAEPVAQAIRHAVGAVARITDRQGDSLIVLTTTDTRKEDREVWDRIEAIDDVLSLNLIYHNFEDATEATP